MQLENDGCTLLQSITSIYNLTFPFGNQYTNPLICFLTQKWGVHLEPFCVLLSVKCFSCLSRGCASRFWNIVLRALFKPQQASCCSCFRLDLFTVTTLCSLACAFKYSIPMLLFCDVNFYKKYENTVLVFISKVCLAVLGSARLGQASRHKVNKLFTWDYHMALE